ncbi:MAG: hypothetical protein U1C72_00630 [Candidatus Pacearchaeota archaeon]|nr:hypothetical protein [Candidatus Pacearchaeota archaeon]
MAFLQTQTVQTIILILKILSLTSALGMLAFIIFIILRTQWIRFRILFDLNEFFTFRPYGVRRVTKAWEKLQGRLGSANESEYKLAVIEADRMLDQTLERLNIQGENLQERLAVTTAVVVPNIQEVTEATQIRNNIVHDPDYRLSLAEARKALSAYEEAFRQLDLL